MNLKLVLLLATFSLAFATGCDSDGGGPDTPSTPPVFSSPIISLDSVTEFLPFGVELSPGQLNPAYEFRTDSDMVEVVSASAGEVVDIIANPASQGDFEMVIRPVEDSYRLYYDHVLDLSVSVGDQVQPGDRLGIVGNWLPGEGRVEVQINHEENGTTVSRCPEQFGTAALNAAHSAEYAETGTEPGGPCLTDVVDP